MNRSQFLAFSMSDFLNLFNNDYPLLHQFESTEQDPIWHSEGNVLIHTDMVLNEARKIIGDANLSESDSMVLYMAALLHDYGKPLTTKPVMKERLCIGAKHHEEVGASLLFNSKKPHFLTEEEWLQVILLVQYHNYPKMMVLGDKKINDYSLLLSMVKRIDLLYYLELADMRGRICDDFDDGILYVETFKMESQSHNLFEANYADVVAGVLEQAKNEFNAVTQSDTLNKLSVLAIAKYHDNQFYCCSTALKSLYGHLEGFSHFVLLCGIPASGKSTYVNQEYPDYNVVSLDEIRSSLNHLNDQSKNDEVVRIAFNSVKELLREHKNIVLDATNYRTDFRSKFCQLGFNYGAFVQIDVLQSDLKNSISRNKNRPAPIKEEAIVKQFHSFQIPFGDEAHLVKFKINSN